MMPHDELLVTTPAQVRALASGVRTAVVESLLVDGPSPVRDLARRLSRSAESLYHHIRILETAGIIRVVEVRPAARTSERIFALVARRMRLDRGNSSPAMRKARAAAAAALLAATSRRARAAIVAGLDEGGPTAKRARVETLMLPLTPDQLEELHARVDSLWAFLRDCREAEGGPQPNQPVCAITVAVTPEKIREPGRTDRPARPARATRGR